MDIDGVGEQLASTLMNAGLVKDPSDLYKLTKADLTELERMGDKSAQNVIDAIDASRRRPLRRVLFALGIRHVGSETATLLAEHFGSIDSLIDAAAEEIEDVPGIGPIVAQAVHGYFQKPATRRLIDRLRRRGVEIKGEAPARREGPLSGQTFVITGTLDAFPRSEAETRVKSLGAAVGASVTKKTTALVAGYNPGSKLDKAREYGTTVLEEGDFLAVLREHGALD
jgi:DNA ligase (NAD+)